MGPNGVMLIFTGLLLRIENEAQLAAVMSHEIGHFVRRHSLQQLRAWRSRNAGLQTFAAILSAGTAIASAQANSALAAGDLSTAASRYDLASTIASAGSALLGSLQVWAIMSQLEYSRDQETESDDLGLDWMALAGYDPGVVDDIWQYMQKEDEASELGVPAYLRTHPLPEDRMLRNRQRAAELSAVHPDARTIQPENFMAAIAPYRHAWLGSARAGLDRQSEELLIERQRQLGVDPGLVLFHEADMLRKRGEPHQSNLALQAYQRATRPSGRTSRGFAGNRPPAMGERPACGSTHSIQRVPLQSSRCARLSVDPILRRGVVRVIHRTIIFFICLIGLHGCQSYSLISAGSHDLGPYAVETPIEWNRSPGAVPSWTVDGLALQSLVFVSGIDDGDRLFPSIPDDQGRAFQENMRSSDLARAHRRELCPDFGCRGHRNQRFTSGRFRALGGVPVRDAVRIRHGSGGAGNRARRCRGRPATRDPLPWRSRLLLRQVSAAGRTVACIYRTSLNTTTGRILIKTKLKNPFPHT